MLGGDTDPQRALPADDGAVVVGDSVGSFATRLFAGEPSRAATIVIDAARGITPRVVRDARLLAELGITELEPSIRGLESGPSADATRERLLTEFNALNVGQATRTDPLRDAGPRDAAASDRFRVKIVWTGQEPLLPGRAYALSLGEQSSQATVAPLRYRLDLATGEHLAATSLSADQLGICDIELTEPIRPEATTGLPLAHFTLSDPVSGAPAAVGLIEYALRRGANIHWQALTIDRATRSAHLGQRPAIVWLTGLSGAGKSTIANQLELELQQRGRHTYLLDGDNVRQGLCSDLGFTAADRVENIRRVAEVARLMLDAGLIVIVSFISPFRAERQMARSLVEPGAFIEVHVDTPLHVAEQRDPKGLYRKARSGELTNLTGIDSPYEPPEDPELRIDTTTTTPAEAAARIVEKLDV